MKANKRNENQIIDHLKMKKTSLRWNAIIAASFRLNEFRWHSNVREQERNEKKKLSFDRVIETKEEKINGKIDDGDDGQNNNDNEFKENEEKRREFMCCVEHFKCKDTKADAHDFRWAAHLVRERARTRSFIRILRFEFETEKYIEKGGERERVRDMNTTRSK